MIGPLETGFAAEFTTWLSQTFPDTSPVAIASAGLVAERAAQGHVCIDLSAEAGTQWGDIVWPDAREWATQLRQAAFVGIEDADRPLVLEGARLYLAQLWDDECRLADSLRQRAGPSSFAPEQVKRALAPYFGHDAADLDQRMAAATALLNRVTLIAGGPGTGKTTTVARVLAAFIQLAPNSRIVLAAPTGKAASRMTEAMHGAQQRLALDLVTRAALPEAAVTLHRLLGYRPGSATPQHHARNPLPLDLLVVDEASMVDQALFRRLLDALPPSAGLILLGDDRQLASVEAGSVFADLVSLGGASVEGAKRLKLATGQSIATVPAPSVLGDAVARLRTSRRFADTGGIGALAARVRDGDADGTLALLEARDPAIRWENNHTRQWSPRLIATLGEMLADYRAAVDAQDVDRAWQAFNRLGVLSPLREGSAGIEPMNRAIEAQLFGQDIRRRPFYAGRPIIIRANDPAMGLSNGDIGLLINTPEGMRAHFFGREGWRRFLPARLPRHETAFVLTVHQSQGSEYDAVWLLLPDESSPILDRSLLYTAITRARQAITVWGTGAQVRVAVTAHRTRQSGLVDRLSPDS